MDGVGHANGNGSVMAEANGAAVDDPQGGTATDTNTSGSANPTVMPKDVLSQFHFAFLIRHPRRAIPSYYRCTVPPLDEVTGFHDFMPSEAGYDELRRLFDYLKDEGLIGPARAGQPAGQAPRPDEVRITVIDADDLLDKPEEVIRAFCVETGIDFSPDMLAWKDEQNQQRAVKAFEKWKGFHNDAIDSDSLKPRKHGVVWVLLFHVPVPSQLQYLKFR